jgi:hypothetical protein
MPQPDTDRLKAIKSLPQLVAYLRDELDWPIESAEPEEILFDYAPGELGLDAKAAVNIKEIRQLRPLAGNQPWGIFFVNFEKKQLPVSVMRLILRALVFKKRASANKADRQAWQPHDLLFVSSCGTDNNRSISFAHFVENKETELSELRVLGWDDDDTPLHMDYVSRMLHEKLGWDAKLASNPEEWRTRWSEAFLLKHRHTITKADELAEALAELATKLRNRLRTLLKYEDGHGEIRKLQRAFEVGLIHDLNDESFSDMFAQTVTYGLFSVAVRRTFPGEGTAVTKDDPANLIFTSPFLKEMLGVFLGLKSRKGKIDFDQLGISDVTDLLNSPDTHMEVVLADFNNKTRGEDPVIHFYEHFLSSYNKKLKVERGVFYTPQPVVSYIVRSVHELLKTEFGLEDGLADITTWGEMLKKHPGLKLPPLTDEPGEKRTISPDEPFVQILDPATGTATFLVEVIEVIHRTLAAKWKQQGLTDAQQQAAWNDYVPKHLLPRLHGFELMMAPYAIAHMKIGLKLAETGYRFGTEERARIYLTNALEPWVKQLPLIGFDALAQEAAAVNEIKWYKRFTVVIGNPPYAVSSHNKSPFIERLMTAYKTGLERERNIQPLSDDYIKFVCFAQHLLDVSGQGILGFITNHSYLSGVIHRTMRKSLLATFDNISVTDLHGNSFINEHPPGGIRDSNVFEIQQGVSLFLGCRKDGGATAIRFSELWGTGEAKLATLSGSRNAIAHTAIKPDADYAFFVPKDFSQAEDYNKWPSLADVFGTNQNGVQTGHDGFSVAFDRKTVVQHVEDFFNPALSDNEVSQRYELGDNSGWSFAQKRRQLRGSALQAKLLVPYFYRPFDLRFIYYDPNLLKRPSPAIMPHLVDGKNMALFAMRKIVPTFAYSFFGVVNSLVDHGHFYMGNQGSSSCFPLYIKPAQQRLGTTANREHNFQSQFCDQLSKALGTSTTVDGLPAGLTPEDIFRYAYAVFHSPCYRSRYAEFLKIDFPRLPLTGNLELFRALARLGGELTALHLMESSQLTQPSTEFIGSRHHEVEKISWSRNTVWVDKAQTTGFQGVREEVWNFHIGGYQVCEKWLKDRKGRTLTKDDLAHYQKVVVALSETIRLMKEIDEVIEKAGGWPGAFASVVQAPKEKSIQVEESSASSSPPLQESLPLEVQPTIAGVPADDHQAEQKSKPTKTRVTSGQDDDKPVRIDETEQNEVLCTIRQMFSEGLELSRELAFKKIAKELGYDRVGSKIEETLDSDIRTAVKRGILENERGTLKILCKTIEGYERDFLKDQFLASIGRPWVEREEGVRAFTRFMGFRRAGEKIQDTVRSLINGLLREDRLESDGHLIRRKS